MARLLIEEGHKLEGLRHLYQNLGKCSELNHEWVLVDVKSTLDKIQTIELICKRCQCKTLSVSSDGGEVYYAEGLTLNSLMSKIEEE